MNDQSQEQAGASTVVSRYAHQRKLNKKQVRLWFAVGLVLGIAAGIAVFLIIRGITAVSLDAQAAEDTRRETIMSDFIDEQQTKHDLREDSITYSDEGDVVIVNFYSPNVSYDTSDSGSTLGDARELTEVLVSRLKTNVLVHFYSADYYLVSMLSGRYSKSSQTANDYTAKREEDILAEAEKYAVKNRKKWLEKYLKSEKYLQNIEVTEYQIEDDVVTIYLGFLYSKANSYPIEWSESYYKEQQLIMEYTLTKFLAADISITYDVVYDSDSLYSEDVSRDLFGSKTITAKHQDFLYSLVSVGEAQFDEKYIAVVTRH